eukprot:CAMPEP_0116573724 /NCGR_PEP_ID=MMETSP0397-20121206/18959_1 /TAXON_ID=216820 /ORGANISM="Cyclophora tenuis, Strain ECT3854" /LENGTH=90 /DNA_ID=CAMNT_0004102333 /DNA_START=179 /DNA_END=451 /DNA_ORIENTATION=+
MASLALDDEVKHRTEVSYKEFLEKVWTEDAMFMNYLEGMQFATACANVVAHGGELTDDIMAPILKQQASVMTVRGPVRLEYTGSMNLSRL